MKRLSEIASHIFFVQHKNKLYGSDEDDQEEEEADDEEDNSIEVDPDDDEKKRLQKIHFIIKSLTSHNQFKDMSKVAMVENLITSIIN